MEDGRRRALARGYFDFVGPVTALFALRLPALSIVTTYAQCLSPEVGLTTEYDVTAPIVAEFG